MKPEEYAKQFFDDVLMSRHAACQEEKHLLPHGEFGILAYLFYQHDGANVGELTEFLRVTSGRTACALNSLERKNMVNRLADKKDNRKVCVYITDKGRQTVQTEYENAILSFSKLFEKLGEDDSREYIRIMKKIVQ